MRTYELLIIAIGLSMDAFAVSVCKGLSLNNTNIKNSAIVGLYFGTFQAFMPLIGYFIGIQFQDYITAIDHWIAFILLVAIGLNMIKESTKNTCEINNVISEDKIELINNSVVDEKLISNVNETIITKKEDKVDADKELQFKAMILLAIATSIDALTVGITFAFLQVNIFSAVSMIGIVTFIFSFIGVKIGSTFGMKFKSKAELAGGIILIVMGIKILLGHI
ncbi:MAG: manganese efflux pump MntP family protein [Sedimentibacter sp.]